MKQFGKLFHAGNRREELLIDACQKRNLEQIQSLLFKGVNIDYQDKNQRTALMFAAGSGNEGAFLLLISANANIYIKDKNGKSAEDFATESNHFTISRHLRNLSEQNAPQQSPSPYRAEFQAPMLPVPPTMNGPHQVTIDELKDKLAKLEVEKANRISDLNKVIAGNSTEMSELCRQLGQTHTALNDLEQQLNFSRAKNAEYESKITEKDTKISNLQSKVTQNETQKSEFQRKILEKEATVKNLKETLKTNQKKIIEQADQMKGKDIQISDAEERLSQSLAQILQFENNITERETQIFALNNDLSETRAQVAALEERISNQDNIFPVLETQILNSTTIAACLGLEQNLLNIQSKLLAKKTTIEEEIKFSKLCVICMSGDKVIALNPCGHLVFCEVCSQIYEDRKCPICGGQSQSRTRVYF